MNKTLLKFATLGVLATTAAVPVLGAAQTYRQHRDQKKNEWKNIGIGAAAIGVYGLIKGDKTLTTAGLAGAAYSAYRYGQDGKNDRRYDRYGYDQNGYNRSGYNREGYNRDGVDRYGRRRDAYGYNGSNRYDRNDGWNRDDRYDRDDRDDRYARDGRSQRFEKWNGRGPGNSDFGHSHGKGKGHGKHGDCD